MLSSWNIILSLYVEKNDGEYCPALLPHSFLDLNNYYSYLGLKCCLPVTSWQMLKEINVRWIRT